ncbi:class I SAM-dependent methyltransferase [Oleiagrimonas citrea]|uniref:Class I SAM-dependent methyltransferase n=1 Tax=Oleiagrimonas citrea TaxID=1665687 RepID=A0A846ZKB5_9GAMM|nr:class I SAM-dependent methyltransferase [Oleiagrimonas citrea]NKZ38009.1 class I SAM-dependent methyltransferase [Oleiagrimonas citrea]
MNASRQDHWQTVYRGTSEQQTSWYRPHLDASLRSIDALDLPHDAPVIDVGGGRSTLVDDLLDRGFRDLTVLDLSEAALAQSRARLGAQTASVHWLADDVTETEMPAARYALWHDRAVFHFLIEDIAQQRYLDAAAHATREGGYVIVATFAADGPERCSGLPVARYDAGTLAARFAPHFECVDACRDVHRTPFDTEQPFTYLTLRRRDDATGNTTS